MTALDTIGQLSELDAALEVWLPRQRWFADKGRPLERISVRQVFPFSDAVGADEPAGVIAVVRVEFAGGRPAADYQLPLGVGAVAPAAPGGSVIAQLPGGVVFDALADPGLAARLVRRIAADEDGPGLRFEAEPPGFKPPWHALKVRQLAVEQSNSSVVVDEQYVLKIIRKLVPGTNPDLELQRMLRGAKSRHVPRLLGAVEGRLEAAPATLAILQEYVPAASEGWRLALDSVRELLAGDARSDRTEDAGAADFAAEAAGLGETVAAVHGELAATGGTVPLRRADLARIAGSMTTRLDSALDAVPELAEHERELRAAFAAVADLPPEMVGAAQRIHGDLHLGQALRTATQWLIIDFEGEPGAALSERRARYSPARDVAGMLRSFEYAAYHQLNQIAVGRALDNPAARVAQWTARNQSAFCSGYAAVTGRDPRCDGALLTAYQLDKAVYELRYETRHRPAWAWIPLGAIGRLLAEAAR